MRLFAPLGDSLGVGGGYLDTFVGEGLLDLLLLLFMCVSFMNMIDEGAVAAALADRQGAVAADIIMVRPLGVASW